MDTISNDPHPVSAWRRVGRSLEHVQNWPDSENSPYSPLLCLSLLLAIGLIVVIGH
jgi:hypothetical protein